MFSRTICGAVVLALLIPSGDVIAQALYLPEAMDHFRRGFALIEKGEFDKALESLNKSIRLDPNFSNAYVSRSCAWAGKREYDKSLADCDKAISLDARNYVAYTNRGNMWFIKNNYESALVDYNSAIRISPTYPYAYSGRGNARSMQKQCKQAISDYDEAIRLSPRFATAHGNRAGLLLHMKQYKDAVEGYKTAIVVDPEDRYKNHKYPHGGLAWIMATCPVAEYRDGEKAVGYATRACELSGWADGLYLDILASAYAETGDFCGAVEWQRQAIQLLPEDDQEYKPAQDRMQLYLDKRPYRDDNPSPLRFK